MISRYVSDIPKDTIEKVVSEYKSKGAATWFKKTECWCDGKIVGERFYEKDGTLIIESPLKEGKKHGVEYYWNEDGTLSFAEPYENGLIHGKAVQWDGDGNVIGTYTLNHGTGYDIWRLIDENGNILISEIHSMKDGMPHGFEWWLNDDQESVYVEQHWFEGKRHGIERRWESENGLIEGWPKYWVNNSEVTQSQYINCSKNDTNLPPYMEKDQKPKRLFPEEIIKIIKG